MELTVEKHIQKNLMKYLKNSFSLILALLIATTTFCQNQNEVSNLKDFCGIWKFTPAEGSDDTTFEKHYIIRSNVLLSVTLWKDSRNLYALGPYTIGFFNGKIAKLSDLQSKGNRMYFFEKYPNAPNDSIKYYREAIENCFASFNGIGMDDFEPSETKNAPNCLFFNFNGRDYECWEQQSHLPNYIVQALMKQNQNDWEKVRQLLPHDYKMVVNDKAIIYSQPETATRMYILKNDVVEIYETKGDWLKIKYYIEKNNKDTGKTIEGWIKKSDVE